MTGVQTCALPIWRMKGVSSLLNKTHERESQKPEINNEPILAQDNINEFIENAPRFSENELDAILEKFLKTKTI